MTEPLRIMELRCADGPGGGPEKTILLGAARSDPSRFAVFVCYLRHKDDGDTTIRDRAKQLDVDYRELRQRGTLDIGVFADLRRVIREKRIDIIHSHDYKSDLLALLLARCGYAIPIATAHGWTGHSRREKNLYYPVDRWLLARFPVVIAVSGQLRDALIRSGASSERVRVILNGIDARVYRRHPNRVGPSRNKLGLSPDDVVIGAVGRLEPQKRFDLLVQAFAHLSSSRPSLRLLIAGEGGCRAMLESQAERLGLSDSFRLIGHCSDIVEFYHAIDVCVQSSDYEGTSNVVLEAMAQEVVVVATNVGGTSELVDDGIHGFIVPPSDPEALAGAIAKALDGQEETATKVHAARMRVETELSFDRRQQALESIYVELAKSSKQGQVTLEAAR